MRTIIDRDHVLRSSRESIKLASSPSLDGLFSLSKPSTSKQTLLLSFFFKVPYLPTLSSSCLLAPATAAPASAPLALALAARYVHYVLTRCLKPSLIVGSSLGAKDVLTTLLALSQPTVLHHRHLPPIQPIPDPGSHFCQTSPGLSSYLITPL